MDARNHDLFWAVSFFQGAVKGPDIFPARLFGARALDAIEIVHGPRASDSGRVEHYAYGFAEALDIAVGEEFHV